MTTEEKVRFLRKEFIPLLQNVDPGKPPRWGKMNFLQMVEHLSYTFDIASGKIITTAPPDDEKLRKMRAWLMTEKPFRENTTNPLLSSIPPPPQHNTPAVAINELQISIIALFHAYESDPVLKVPNPIFGDLNFNEQIQLCYKHSTHHLRQFGVTILQKSDDSE